MLADVINILKNRPGEVDEWLSSQWEGLTPNIYLSCDIRHSGHKICVVDTNMYPAGFNNLCHAFSKITSGAFAAFLDSCPFPAKKIMIYPEAHTRNKFYLKNLFSLAELIRQSGRDAKIGLNAEFVGEGLFLSLEEGPIHLHPLRRDGARIVCGGMAPDMVLLNNDLSSGMPDILKGLEQPVLPTPEMGWHRRRKNIHFRILESILLDFARNFQFDPWLLFPITDYEEQINWDNTSNLQSLSRKIDKVLATIGNKYREYGIREAPYVYLKNNVGTYGMGMLPLFSGEDLMSLNRRRKDKLLSSKGGNTANGFLIMEGIHTCDFYSGYPIEPVIYAVGREDVGGFFRIHESKNEWESLNAPGMTFSCLCLHKLDEPHEEYFLECREKRDVVAVSRLLAKMASLAAAREREQLEGNENPFQNLLQVIANGF